MAIYPAYVHVDNDGSASGYFPDVKGCIFAINAGEDLFAEASSALDAHFEALVSEGIEIPEAHDMLTTFTVTHAITLMADSGIT